ncbi:hypothetical protein KBA73_01810, partial [Patescibacteria group bacterium]|nr:hypothetical protein [Patescibacteria group bacterium]
MYTNLFSTKTAVSLHSARSILAAFLTLSFLIAPLASYAKGGGDGGGGGGGAGVTCTFTGDVSSDWAVAGNWSCGHVPTESDFVVIPNTETAESSALGAVGTTLEIQMGGSLTVSGGTLTIGNTIEIQMGGSLTVSGGTLTIGNTITNAGLFTSTGGTTTASTGGITNSGGMALNGGTLSSGLNSFTNSGTINGSGAGAILEAGFLGNLPGGIINHTGGWQIRAGSGGFTNMGTYNSTADDSIFRFTGSGSAVPTTVTYPNLEFGGSISPSDNSRFVAHGDIALLTGLIFTANSSTFVLSGNWTAEAATAISNNHTTVEFTGSATSTLTADPGGAAFYDIKVNKAAVDKGVMLLSDAMATHALVMTKGIFDYNGYTLFLPESCTFVGGSTPSWGMPANWSCAGAARLPNVIDTVTIPNGKSPVLSSLVTRV